MPVARFEVHARPITATRIREDFSGSKNHQFSRRSDIEIHPLLLSDMVFIQVHFPSSILQLTSVLLLLDGQLRGVQRLQRLARFPHLAI